MELLNRKSNLFVPFLITLIGSILIIATIFLPVISANDDHEEFLAEIGDTVIDDETELTGDDMISLTLSEFAKSYGSVDDSTGFYTALTVLIGIFGGLCILFSLLKLPVPIIIFSILSYCVSAFTMMGVTFSNAMDGRSPNYEASIGYYLPHIAVAVTLVGAIYLLIVKIKNKKAAKNANTTAQQ